MLTFQKNIDKLDEVRPLDDQDYLEVATKIKKKIFSEHPAQLSI